VAALKKKDPSVLVGRRSLPSVPAFALAGTLFIWLSTQIEFPLHTVLDWRRSRLEK
jgi:hypothetical protein